MTEFLFLPIVEFNEDLTGRNDPKPCESGGQDLETSHALNFTSQGSLGLSTTVDRILKQPTKRTFNVRKLLQIHEGVLKMKNKE